MLGGRTGGGFHLIGDDGALDFIIVVEGFATGMSIHLATGYPVAVAFCAHNKRVVARTFAAMGTRVLIARRPNSQPLARGARGAP
jgi:phage/plasmid primase-like uncharacterized protein